MSRKMCHHDRSIISSPPSRSLSHLYGVHYPIHIIRVLKKKPGHYYLIIILPLSLSLYSIYLSGPFLFFGLLVIPCRVVVVLHDIFSLQRVQFLRQRSVSPGGMRFDTHTATTPDVKNFVQVDKHFRLFFFGDILFRWRRGIEKKSRGRLFLVCHWARHPHLLHHRCTAHPIRNAEYFDTDDAM